MSDSLQPLVNHSTPGLPVHHQLWESIQTHVHWVGDAIQPSHPLSSPSSPALNLSQHQGLFKWVSFLHQVAKVLEFQLQRWHPDMAKLGKWYLIDGTLGNSRMICCPSPVTSITKRSYSELVLGEIGEFIVNMYYNPETACSWVTIEPFSMYLELISSFQIYLTHVHYLNVMLPGKLSNKFLL